MKKENRIWKCPECGMIVEELHACGCGEECKLTCCGKELILLEPKTTDFKTEKHVPIPAAEQPAEGMKVLVGSTPHPMLPEHYIEWIEVINGPYSNRKYLKPGEAPEASFHVKLQKGMILREYCNLHGLWTYEVK